MKILIAGRVGSQAAALSAQLRAQDDDFAVTLVDDGEDLLDAVRRSAPDMVIVDMARPDRDGLDSVRTLSARQMLPVVMFVDDDDPAFMEEAISAGVSSYHVHGVALPDIKPVLRTAMAFFKRTLEMSTRLAEAEEQIAARQKIDAAKRLLMANTGMNEPAAHRYLRRKAMDNQKKLHEMAEIFLQERRGKGTHHG
jgi:response regulator NasT